MVLVSGGATRRLCWLFSGGAEEVRRWRDIAVEARRRHNVAEARRRGIGVAARCVRRREGSRRGRGGDAELGWGCGARLGWRPHVGFSV